MTIAHSAKVLFGIALRPFHAGDQKLAAQKLPAAPSIQIHSPAFAPNTPIPQKYSGEGRNISPPLQWSGVPADAKELLLVCEDPDAPFPQPYLHWIAYQIPPTLTGLPEALPAVAAPPNSALRQTRNANNTDGYTGPMPPPGHGIHHYHFQLFALDAPLQLPAQPTREQILEAAKNHLLAEGELVGTYERK